jgi:hypothetical protein
LAIKTTDDQQQPAVVIAAAEEQSPGTERIKKVKRKG